MKNERRCGEKILFMSTTLLSRAHNFCYALETVNLWDIDGKFSLKIVSAGNLNVSKDASVSEFKASYS